MAARDDDRMRVRVSFDTEALTDLRFEECIECILPLSERIDFSSHRASFQAATYDRDVDYLLPRIEDAAVSVRARAGALACTPFYGRYWARTSDPQLVEIAELVLTFRRYRRVLARLQRFSRSQRGGVGTHSTPFSGARVSTG